MLRRLLLLTATFVALVTGSAAAQAQAPSAVTGAATDVARDVATLNGSVNPRGQATQYWFEYGTSTALGSRTTAVDAGNGTDSFTVDAQIGSLRADTTYRYRLVARNATGTTEGATRTLRTAAAPAPAPTAATNPARDVTQASATLVATLNNRNQAASYHFEYGPTTSYGTSTPATALGASAAAQTVTAAIAGLRADQAYHVRVVLVVGDRTVRSSDRSFRTAREPNGLLLQASGSPVSLGRGVDVFGVLAGSANASRTIRVQADPFPFDGAWTDVASGRTDATGAYRIAVGPLMSNTRLRTIAETSPAVTSQTITVGVRLSTSLRVSATRVRAGARVRFSGTVDPHESGAAISIQQRRSGTWVTVARTRTSDGGAFSRRVRISRSGKVRVVARSHSGANVMGASASRYIRVGR